MKSLCNTAYIHNITEFTQCQVGFITFRGKCVGAYSISAHNPDAIKSSFGRISTKGKILSIH